MNIDNHEMTKESLGAFATGALDSTERKVVEDHLNVCDECREEVDGYIDALANLTEDSDASPLVWGKITQAIDAPAPKLQVSRITGRNRGFSMRVSAAFAAAAVLIGLLGFKVIDQDRRIDSISAGSFQEALFRASVQAVADPDAKRVTMRSADEKLTAKLVILPDGTGYMVRDNLPRLSDSRTYQLWALADGAKISLGVVGTDPDVFAFQAAIQSDGFAITDEVSGGVETTSRNPVVVGFVRA